jgi:hypothetical protein
MRKSRRGSYSKSAKKGYVDSKRRWRDAHHTTSKVEIPGPLADAIDNLTNSLDTHIKGQYIFSILKIKEDENYSGDIVAAVSPFVGCVSPNRGREKS